MNIITIMGMEFFAFHGHYPEEKTAGNRFILNIKIWTDTESAGLSDNIQDALNYQTVYAIIKNKMDNSNSNLLENLGHNILKSLFEKFPLLYKAELEINKMHPPMGGQITSVGVVLTQERE
jgi:7,8-dihydroneopterin aldolase/epimerase/oxygenase